MPTTDQKNPFLIMRCIKKMDLDLGFREKFYQVETIENRYQLSDKNLIDFFKENKNARTIILKSPKMVKQCIKQLKCEENVTDFYKEVCKGNPSLSEDQDILRHV